MKLKKVLILVTALTVLAAPAWARNSKKALTFEFEALPADTSIIISPGFSTERWGYDFVRYQATDGPCSLFVFAANGWNYADTTSSDTLRIPMGNADIGNLLGMNPQPVYFNQEIDSLRIGVSGTLAFLRIFWEGKKPLW